jgi:hypothetical protein
MVLILPSLLSFTLLNIAVYGGGGDDDDNSVQFFIIYVLSQQL